MECCVPCRVVTPVVLGEVGEEVAGGPQAADLVGTCEEVEEVVSTGQGECKGIPLPTWK